MSSRFSLREWWRQLQYIGDAKSGTYKGKDQCVYIPSSHVLPIERATRFYRFGNRYFENLNPEEEIPGASS